MSIDIEKAIDNEKESFQRNFGQGISKDDIKYELRGYSVKVIDFHYTMQEPAITPNAAVSISCVNDSPVTNEFTVNKTKSETTTASFEWGLNEGLKLGVETEVKCGLPSIAEGKVKVNAALTLGSHQDWKKETAQTWSINEGFKVTMPPYSYNILQIIVQDAKLSGTFDMKLSFDFWSLYLTDGESSIEMSDFYIPNSNPHFVLRRTSPNELTVNGTFKGQCGLDSLAKIKTTPLKEIVNALEALDINYDKTYDTEPSKEILHIVEKLGTDLAVIPL